MERCLWEMCFASQRPCDRPLRHFRSVLCRLSSDLLLTYAPSSAFRSPKSVHSDPSRRSPSRPRLPAPARARRRPPYALVHLCRFIVSPADGCCSLVERARTGPRAARPLRVISLSHAPRRRAGGPGAGQAVPVASRWRDAARAHARTRKISMGDSRATHHIHRRTHLLLLSPSLFRPCRHRSPWGVSRAQPSAVILLLLPLSPAAWPRPYKPSRASPPQYRILVSLRVRPRRPRISARD